MPLNKKIAPAILSQNLFPVVGIGASAGGLDAFKKFIKAIPAESGMAYIIVQHLHPEHDSALPEILQRVTAIPVIEISDNVHVEPDHIYVIPTNKMLVATDGVLKLSPRPFKKGLNMPIDKFFSSLAEVHQSHAIGVVLSGTGADGTAGLEAIKNYGGLSFAQLPDSSSYEGMPQHAIDAAVVDFILEPENIPGKLMEVKETFPIISHTDKVLKDYEDVFRPILTMLRVRSGLDFSHYKQSTVRRRIVRRMIISKQKNIGNYLEYLRENKPEQDLLFQDLLIPVTDFFRDRLIFNNLCETVLPAIIENLQADAADDDAATDQVANQPLRIWVVACSTGQEAYSIAICCYEYISAHNLNIKVQIFATDASEPAIIRARTGIYSKAEVEGVSLKRFAAILSLKRTGSIN